MTRSKIQVQGRGDLKCVKIADLKVISSINMYVIKRLTVNYDTL